MPGSSILTYARLYRFLQDLGFVFRHRPSNTILVQAIHSSVEPVNLVDLKSTRRILDEKGLFSAADFDQFATASPRPSATS